MKPNYFDYWMKHIRPIDMSSTVVVYDHFWKWMNRNGYTKPRVEAVIERDINGSV